MSEIQTPETDEVLRRNAESDQTPQEDYEILADHAANLEYRLAEKTKEVAKIQHFATVNGTAELERQIAEAREQLHKDKLENPWCEACKEEHCAVSGDGTCAMIRRYLAGISTLNGGQQ